MEWLLGCRWQPSPPPQLCLAKCRGLCRESGGRSTLHRADKEAKWGLAFSMPDVFTFHAPLSTFRADFFQGLMKFWSQMRRPRHGKYLKSLCWENGRNESEKTGINRYALALCIHFKLFFFFGLQSDKACQARWAEAAAQSGKKEPGIWIFTQGAGCFHVVGQKDKLSYLQNTLVILATYQLCKTKPFQKL